MRQRSVVVPAPVPNRAEPCEPAEIAPGLRLRPEALRFTFSSSSGPGGQNVNKRATQAELRIALADIPLASDAVARLASLAGRRLTDAGEILITSGEHRSQERNKAECLARLREMLVRAMTRPRNRKATRPSRGSVERRLNAKRHAAERKRARRSGGDDA
jgi:ribosome-associated protein